MGKMRRPPGQRRDQDFAEKIRGDYIELPCELQLQHIARAKLDVPDAVGARVSVRDSAGDGVIIDRKHSCRTETSRRKGENAAARAGVQHRPAGRALARVTFEQAQTHRRGRVLARAERCFGGDDNRAGARLGSFPVRCGANDQPRSDAERFDARLLREILQPSLREFLRAASQLANQGAGLLECRAGYLEQTVPAFWPLDDCKGSAKAVIQVLASESKPIGRYAFSPEIHGVSSV